MKAAVAVPFMYSGRPEEAIELVKKAMRLSPYYPAWYLAVLGHAYRLTGQYEEAITLLESWRARANPRGGRGPGRSGRSSQAKAQSLDKGVREVETFPL
jgi:tetratricopeptide (TPR) repeat protein